MEHFPANFYTNEENESDGDDWIGLVESRKKKKDRERKNKMECNNVVPVKMNSTVHVACGKSDRKEKNF